MSLPALWLRHRLMLRDERTLAELYDAHGPLVYRHAFRVTGDWAAAQDITQDVFSYLWEHPARFDPDRGDLRTWLSVITHRRAVDWVRHEISVQRQREHAGSPAVVPGPAEQVITSWAHELIRRAVDALPAEQRIAIRLAYFEGHTYRHVAAVLGIPEGTAKSRLRLALAALSRRLVAYGMS